MILALILVCLLVIAILWFKRERKTPLVTLQNTGSCTENKVVVAVQTKKPSTPSKWSLWRAIRWVVLILLLFTGYTAYQYANDDNSGIDFVDDAITNYLKKNKIGIYAPNYDALADAPFPFCSQRWDATTGKGVGEIMYEGAAVTQRMEPNTLQFVLVDRSDRAYLRTTYDNEFKNGVRYMSWSRFTTHPNSPQCTRGAWNWSDTAELSPYSVKDRKLDGVYTCTFADPMLKSEGHTRHFWMDTKWNKYSLNGDQCSQ